MRKATFLQALCVACFACVQLSAGAPAPTPAPPTYTYGTQMINTINDTGNVSLEGTVVANLQVNGQLKAMKAQIGTMQVTGQAALLNSTVFHASTVTGPIMATHCNFMDALTVSAMRVNFKQSTLTALNIAAFTGGSGPQVVDLKSVTVNGAITFEAGNGVVYADSGSVITGGVVGGVVYHR